MPKWLKIKITSMVLPILFLVSVGFLGRPGELLSFAVLVLAVLYPGIIRFDKQSLYLVLFSMSYSIILSCYRDLSLSDIIRFTILPWGSYVLVYSIASRVEGFSASRLIILLIFGFFLQGMLNLGASIEEYGFNLNNPYRQAYDFWRHGFISVTGASLYYSPACLFAVSVFLTHSKKYRFLAVVAIVGCAIATLLYQNRTLLAAIGILILIYWVNHLGKVRTRKWSAGKLALSGIFLLGLVAIVGDFWGIRSFFADTKLFERLTNEGTVRFQIYRAFLGAFWRYPFGSEKMYVYEEYGYVHNLWFDIYRQTGVIPFLSVTVFSFLSIITALRFAHCNVENEQGELMAYTLLGMTIIAFVEPVLDSNPYIFYLMIMIVAAMNGRLRSGSHAVQGSEHI